MRLKPLPASMCIKLSLIIAGFVFLSPVRTNAEDGMKATTVKFFLDEEKKPAKKGSTAKTKKSSANSVTVKVVPDIIKKALHVSTRSETEKEMNFFVFDVEGNLVMNYKTRAGERRTISGLARGTYTYHVFCQDEQVATGRLQFK